MPDISACANSSCEKKDSCYRFQCTGSAQQSYALFTPDPDGSCHYYWEIEPRVRTASGQENPELDI